LQNILVTFGGVLFEVVEETAALGHEFEQTAAGGVILPVAFEVLGEVVDPFGQQGNLHVRAAGVFFVQAQSCNFSGIGDGHFFGS
jgi:hypothetical protein